ncbi:MULTISPECIES: Ohr family peroxiredoxin [Achromobacter]|uniref:General stress protein 17o n=1 Tax=Achromobacter aegrifaciens TaxID=1287736 RepID=A0AAD2KKL6_ACHAE|nr:MULTISPECIES: Ohr family peroxiredoxin [Achromobacter]PTN50932.1 Ohr family peroxiredoxin [Achromobacter xylosoxidans]MBD9382976.1 Ohr family peroxiredoxin [Achromobacter sp. ACM02]MBD9422896.1 Ohr family peroxiredoxin [Achromobacter sp. ACM04]MBD9430030.1 Ohr family peroxiredoxin [Achromobacter sp. ACM03]MBD9471561.1 Ohr family peroxiredoxin [Achromobacter sp. ACM01]
MKAPSAPSVSLLEPYAGAEDLPLYTTTVSVTGGASGHGRSSGRAVSNDGELELELRLPKELGGNGGGTNPEQLFAAGFAACFHGAMKLVATKNRVPLPADFAIHCTTTFAREAFDGLFCIKARLEISLPGLPKDVALALVHETESICPYSKMADQGIASSVHLS